MIALPETFLRGSYPPVITPFRNDAVDYDQYAKLIEFQIESGSHGVVVNGTSAEPSVLTVDERKKLLEVAIDVAANRIPVVAATGSQSFEETRDLTDHATKAGADALLVVTPYYIRPPQRGLVAYYKALGERSDLPLMMYHIPGRAAVNATLDTLKAIVDAVPHFVGMKHASLELQLVTEALRTFGPDFRVFVGLEELSFPMLAMGACGMVNAVSNVAPRQVVDLYEAVARGDLVEGRRLHFALWELNQAVFFDINPIPMKYMARKLGILDVNEHRLPLLPPTAEVEARLDRVLEAAGLMPASRVKAVANA